MKRKEERGRKEAREQACGTEGERERGSEGLRECEID